MAVEINSKIVGQRVKTEAQVNDAVPETPAQPDVDPFRVNLDHRPTGALPSVTSKISYSTQEGRKNIYITLSFITVEGWLDGKKVKLERPLEVFVPNGQLAGDSQWIAATCRSLSMNARTGTLQYLLKDLQKIKWDRGLIRYGIQANPENKPIPKYHDSEVAVIAWEIQQILIKRGFLKENGDENPLAIYSDDVPPVSQETITVELDPNDPNPVETVEAFKNTLINAVGTCSECKSGTLVLRDGCPTCLDCGHSKCG